MNGRQANLDYLADDVRLLMPGKAPIVGREAASRHFQSVEDSFKPLRESTIDGPYTVWVCEGELVAHRFRWCGETHDGQLVDFFLFNLYRVRGGKIDHFEEHFDTLTRARFSYAYDVDTDADADAEPFDPASRILS